jgi:hypothetical protein
MIEDDGGERKSNGLKVDKREVQESRSRRRKTKPFLASWPFEFFE